MNILQKINDFINQVVNILKNKVNRSTIIYINPQTGDDSLEITDSNHPIKTFNRLIELIEKYPYSGSSIAVYLQPGDYSSQTDQFYIRAGGKIYIYGNNQTLYCRITSTWEGSVYLYDLTIMSYITISCNSTLYANNITFKTSNQTWAVRAWYHSYVSLVNCKFNCTNCQTCLTIDKSSCYITEGLTVSGAYSNSIFRARYGGYIAIRASDAQSNFKMSATGPQYNINSYSYFYRGNKTLGGSAGTTSNGIVAG